MITDPQNGATQYGYDTEDNLKSITDALGRVTNFDYDDFGRVTEMHFPSGLVETYSYDAVGNLITKTDRKNQTTSYSYDEISRLTRKQYQDGTAVAYTYDAANKLTQISDPTGTYTFTYDNMGRITQTGTSYLFIPGKNFTVGYGYDAASNRTSMKDLQNGSTSYVYDTLNRLTTLTNPQRNQFTFSHDVLSRISQLVRPNSVKANYQYDSLSRLTSLLQQITTSKGGTTTLDGATYSYDSAENRSSRTDKRTNVVSNYGYDPLYELTSVTQGGSTVESYSLDGVGNRTSSLNVAQYNYNESNQLTDFPGTIYFYDGNGNPSSKSDASGTTLFSWDFDNRLTRVTLPGGAQVSFKYDPMGRRIQKSSSLGTVNYVYDGQNVLEELDTAGNMVARYTQRLGIDTPLAMLRSGTTSYYEADGLGTITSLSNSSGALTNTYTYDSFGKATASTGSIVNPYRYTGREYDSETGLYYYRARYYDPQIGRFISEDSARFQSGTTNFYTYVENDPLNLTDPSGFCDEKKCIPWSSLTFGQRTILRTLSALARRGGGVRGFGVGGSAGFNFVKWFGLGGSTQAMWIADSLGQQGIYWSRSFSEQGGTEGFAAVGGLQYSTTGYNSTTTVQDVVNSNLSYGAGVGAGFGVAADYSTQTGLFTVTVGAGEGGYGGQISGNIKSGFIPICRE